MFSKFIEWYKSANTGTEYFIRAVLTLIALFGVLALLAGLVGCGKATPEDKVAAQMKTQHPLSADERAAAEVNAKQYFEKQWAPVWRSAGPIQLLPAIRFQRQRAGFVLRFRSQLWWRVYRKENVLRLSP